MIRPSKGLGMGKSQALRALGRFQRWLVVDVLAPRLIGWAQGRRARNGKADFEIRPNGELYLSGFRILRSKLLCIYVHETSADDDNRALHDHPWPNISILLRGAYFEIMPYRPKGYVGGDAVKAVRREAGDIVYRRAAAAHRLTLPHPPEPCWSLFITGPRIRDWGFYCPKGWKHENLYRAKHDDGASVGAGCD